MPRKCTICIHSKVTQINKAICNYDSYRDIALRFGVGHMSVLRHLVGCLNLKMQEVIQQGKIGQVIDVHAEFEEQLVFAKDLRVAARDYLSDPLDPLKLTLIPRADEVDVVYYDYDDMSEQGIPAKKTETLSVLLAMVTVKSGQGYRPDMVKIKHVDMRKFALDAIDTADKCIDKFARMAGAYQKDKPNESDPEVLAKKMTEKLVEQGWVREEAMIAARNHFTVSEAVN